MSARLIDAVTLQRWVHDGSEIAVLDVREAGIYGEGHALLAVNLPFSRLELDIAALVPRFATRTVLIAEDDGVSARAANALAAVGYTQVWTLAGGAPAWVAAGFPVFQGVNVPSKAFAEYVEHTFHTPDITPDELAALQAQGADLVLLDSRTVEEHRRFHVPGAIACPGSELVPRFADQVPSANTLVVVSCAGRTRGVMGAQTLINAGVPNRVLALRGGTQGWKLADLAVEAGPAREAPPPSATARAQARTRADAVAQRFGVPRIDSHTLVQWQSETDRTTFLFDVRTQAEYLASHVPGAIGVIGVQLIQCLDQWVAVRGARLVLVDDDGVRATLTAHWLRQLGWDAVAFTAEPEGLLESGLSPARQVDLPTLSELTPAQAHKAQTDGALLLDVSPSAVFRLGHATGAQWVNRSRLDSIQDAVAHAEHVIVLADDDRLARLVALDLQKQAKVAVVAGGLVAWRAAGLPVLATPGAPTNAQRVDHLFWLHDRHEGNAAASAAYLAWEANLPAAIGDPSNAGLRLAAVP